MDALAVQRAETGKEALREDVRRVPGTPGEGEGCRGWMPIVREKDADRTGERRRGCEKFGVVRDEDQGRVGGVVPEIETG